MTPEFLKIPSLLWNKILETSIILNNVRVASPSGIAALKLWRGKIKDIGEKYELYED